MQNYTPLDVSSVIPPPRAPKNSIGTRAKIALLSGFVMLVGVVSGFLLISNGVIFQNQAWETSQSATAKCNSNGTIDIEAKFTNNEPDQPWQAMDVKAKDLQTGVEADMGTVLPGGQSKTVTIQTNRESLNSGVVQFSLEWTQQSRTDVDTRSASYQAAGPCISPTPTVTPTPTNTPTPTPVPQCGSSCQSDAGCPSSTKCSGGKCVLDACLESGTVCEPDKCTVIPPTPTPTPTPTSCPVPEKVNNIKVTCPNC